MPESNLLQDVFVGVFAIAVMGSVGADLTIERVLTVFRRPSTLVIGLGLNHLLVPLAAFGIARLLSLEAAVATGFLLCAAAPGGPLGAMFTQRAGGDIAFAASLIVVMTAINTVSTPLLLGWLVDAPVVAGGSHVWPVVRTILAYLLAPLSLGLALRTYRPTWADRAGLWLRRLTNLLFLALFGMILGTRIGMIGTIGATTLLAMLILATLCAIAGFFVAGRKSELRTALALNTTIRNISLSLLLASLWFSEDATMVTVMVYGLVMLIVALPTVMIIRRLGARSAAEAAAAGAAG